MSVLEVADVAHSYGGLKILDGISFSIAPGERVALIGPNGAGKTTMFNVLSGLLTCQSGTISMLGRDVTHLPPHARVSLGFARSFQINTLFNKLTLLENVLLAIHGTKKSRFQMFRALTSYDAEVARAKELLEFAGLWDRRDEPISTLSHGQQRQLEILLALASKPKLLMLDEPTAGLAAGETDALINMVRNLLGGITFVFCTHDMDLLFGLAERVMVLYYGKILCQGTLEQIQNDPKVMEIYLGTREDSAKVG